MTEESRAGNRLINTTFLKSLTKLTNRARLLYYDMIVWADCMGAVGETEAIITLLQAKADKEGDMGMGLIETDYRSALAELVEKGLIYEVKLTSGNVVHIIKHWWLHNRWKKYLKTNYFKAINEFYIEAGEYRPKEERKKKNQKERKSNTKTNTKTKTNYSSDEELTSQEECVPTHEEPLCNEEEDITNLDFELFVVAQQYRGIEDEDISCVRRKMIELGADEETGLDGERLREAARKEFSEIARKKKETKGEA